ncbi:hypothetical protein FA13DRAFT_774061 [Coprinellus micaceus]|uniref:DUF6533 domain-containing protein n=1 Tax=Coprinellus micaceus TaxID=71717 RepID=A0A4Y7T4X2_COPMI|nr:hypothetical protein FA13DRAFT_774061 [Coprinellus micaceus]
MTMSAEDIQALTDAVAAWRMQEYICIAFYCFYAYYVVLTISKEVSIILPQKWGRGKALHAIIRYGMVVFIGLQLSRDYRNYFSISLKACKALTIMVDVKSCIPHGYSGMQL